MVGKVLFHLCTLYHPHFHPNKTISSFLVLPPQSHQTLLSSFSSPINLSRQEISPSSPAQSSRSNIQEAGTQRDSTAILAKASLGVRGASPGPVGREGVDSSLVLGQAVRYTPQEG